jgi:LacI family transcriptional regulator
MRRRTGAALQMASDRTVAMTKSKRARVIDIAQEAGVSIATVDRVLNKRQGVRPVTADRVWAAAQRLSAARSGTALTLARRHDLRFDFILPAGAGPSMDNLRHYIEVAGRTLGVETRCHAVARMNPRVQAEKIAAAAGESSNGVGFHALEHPLVRDAVEQLADRGIPSIALLSDLSNSKRIGYVGMDNRSAGRTAGYLMGRFVRGGSGKVAILAGSPLYRNHEEREMGFRGILREAFPALEILNLVEGQDEPEANYRQIGGLLDRHAELIGIYSIGSGNRGVVRALRERGKIDAVTLIGHNLTTVSRQFLLDGSMDAVIHQDMRRAANLAVRALLARYTRTETVLELLPVEIFVRENLIE